MEGNHDIIHRDRFPDALKTHFAAPAQGSSRIVGGNPRAFLISSRIWHLQFNINGDLAEERRLAYVALTRGMKRVTVSYALWRRGLMVASPFLADIPAASSVNGWLRGGGANPAKPDSHPNRRLPYGLTGQRQAETA